MFRNILSCLRCEPDTVEPAQIHRVAADWWAQFLLAEDVTFDNGSGDPMHSVLSSALREKVHGDGYDTETALAFREVLAEALAEKDVGGYSPTLYVGTDYHPDSTLREAAHAVDIDPGKTLFPSKTGMWLVDEGDGVRHIDVKVGHGRSTRTIWTNAGPDEDDWEWEVDDVE